MPSSNEFYIWKRTDTYADTLVAVGLTKMLWAITGGLATEINEETSRYRVTLPDPLHLETTDFSILQRNPLYKFIQTKPEETAPKGTESFDYITTKAHADAVREARKRRKAGENLIEIGAPPSIFYVYQKLNILQGISARNKLLEEIVNAKENDLAHAIYNKLTALGNGQLPGDVSTKFSPKVAAVQVFNPAVGKGINRPKTDGATRASLPTAFVDWFEEWLRFIGSDVVLSGYTIGDDIKMSVPVPAKTTYANLSLLEKLETTPAWTSRKSDLFAVFDLVNFLLRKSDENLDSDWRYSVPVGGTPRDVFSSIQTAYFKSLGSAKPVSNISSIGLPDWFPVRNVSHIQLWQAMIDEHRSILRLLDEDKSEEAELLHLYRDFLSATDWLSFLGFLGAYGCLIMSRRDRNKPIRSFSQYNLEELFKMAQTRLPVADVIRNQGFRNIAKAIKQATVSEQYLKSKGQQVFEIKYGLFQEIKRKAKFREELLAVIGEFVTEFNYENARREEQLKDKPGRRRKRVSMQDLEKLAELFDKFPGQKETETIAMLLIAFASSKDEKANDEVQDNDEEEVDL